MVEVGMMVGMAGLQVAVVRFFFQGARKGKSGKKNSAVCNTCGLTSGEQQATYENNVALVWGGEAGLRSSMHRYYMQRIGVECLHCPSRLSSSFNRDKKPNRAAESVNVQSQRRFFLALENTLSCSLDRHWRAQEK
jgi:hypothetical protein